MQQPWQCQKLFCISARFDHVQQVHDLFQLRRNILMLSGWRQGLATLHNVKVSFVYRVDAIHMSQPLALSIYQV